MNILNNMNNYDLDIKLIDEYFAQYYTKLQTMPRVHSACL